MNNRHEWSLPIERPMGRVRLAMPPQSAPRLPMDAGRRKYMIRAWVARMLWVYPLLFSFAALLGWAQFRKLDTAISIAAICFICSLLRFATGCRTGTWYYQISGKQLSIVIDPVGHMPYYENEPINLAGWQHWNIVDISRNDAILSISIEHRRSKKSKVVSLYIAPEISDEQIDLFTSELGRHFALPSAIC